MCIVFSIIEHIYWYQMVILSSMFVGESLYVSFPRSFFICIHFVTYFLWEWDEWPSHRALGHCPFHYYIHCWCDFTSCLIWVDHHFFFFLHIHCFAIILIIAFDSSPLLHPLFFSYTDLFQVWYSPLHHSGTSHYQFDLLHCLIIDILFTLGTLRSMTHKLFYTCCILYTRTWVFDHWVFGLSFLSFLLPYHPSLCYVPCLKIILRPWDQMSSSTALTWTSVWDLVDL